MLKRLAEARAFLHKNGMRVGVEILVNFAMPFLIYDLAKQDLGDVCALFLSSAPPVAWSLFEFMSNRRIDAFSMFILAGIALSLLAFIGGGAVRFLQLRENLVTAIIGALFLGSAAIGRPLIYQLARAKLLRTSLEEAESFDAMGEDKDFRRMMMIMTLVWGFGLVAEAIVASLLVFSLSIRNYLLVGPAVGYITMGVLAVWTFWYSNRQGQMAEECEAAQEEQSKPNSQI